LERPPSLELLLLLLDRDDGVTSTYWGPAWECLSDAGAGGGGGGGS
jgi:hypothetical protein